MMSAMLQAMTCVPGDVMQRARPPQRIAHTKGCFYPDLTRSQPAHWKLATCMCIHTA
jgi:hypothetical protein